MKVAPLLTSVTSHVCIESKPLMLVAHEPGKPTKSFRKHPSKQFPEAPQGCRLRGNLTTDLPHGST
ncbi:hypothetical protein Y024_5907 [Burkholderia pseudomallei TSV44]|nr:hypothetical protein Y024_5907 [Burkholderia pseudomallei TSV44]